MNLFDLVQNPNVYFIVFVVSSMAVGILALIPIRGGNGQHAGAGPGAVMVWQLSETLEAERTARTTRPRIPAISIETADRPGDPTASKQTVDEPPPENVIRWPEEPVAEYVGRHRLLWDIDEHPPCLVGIQLGPDFPGHGGLSLLASYSNPKDSRALSGGTVR
ncbi:hypothetical protein [Saccharopolyspora sp. NPDC002376]